MFEPKWSVEIQGEWKRNLLINRSDLSSLNLDRTQNIMNEAFPSADVKGYSPLTETLELPDDGDRHVLAAAIKSNSKYIITFNLKDFPNQILN